MISSEKEQFRWGPIDGRIIYGSYWIEAAIPLMKKHGMGFSEMIYYFEGEKMTAVLDKEELCRQGIKFFNRYLMSDKEKWFGKWKEYANKIEGLQKHINSKFLHRLTDKELAKCYDEWYQLHMDFWVWGYIAEFANWGGEKILVEHLKNNYPIDFIYLSERLSAPTKLSFYQEEELDLMGIRLLKNKNEQNKRIAEHQKKYYWLSNSYHDTKILGQDYFKKRFNKATAYLAKNKIRSIKNFLTKTKLEKSKIYARYGLSREIMQISENLSYAIWWQDFRKKYIFMLNHLTTLFINEISARKNIAVKSLYLYTGSELFQLLFSNKAVSGNEINNRKKFFLFHYILPCKINHKSGEEAKNAISPYMDKNNGKSQSMLSGMVVSRGKIVCGRAKILSSPKQCKKIRKGDILIAAMTSPDYIIAMRKAAAIVTDQGGITCHAAIVSRELGKPCIVGTKHATKIFKDNDMIEIDTKKGFVRKLS